MSSNLKSIFFNIVLMFIIFTGYCSASDSIFKKYIDQQIEKELAAYSNAEYRNYIESQTKNKIFDIAKLNSYGSYTFENYKHIGSVEFGFNFKLYDYKKNLDIEMNRYKLHELNLDEEEIIQSIIFDYIRNYFNYIKYKIMKEEYKILNYFNPITMDDDDESKFIYTDLHLKREENDFFYTYSINKDFDVIYHLIGMEIFTQEFYHSIHRDAILNELVENNIKLKKIEINEKTDVLDSKKRIITPKIYLDGSYQYNFDDSHELSLSVNSNIVLPTQWSDVDIDLTILKDQVKYYINFLQKENIGNNKQPSFEEIRTSMTDALKEQYKYYLQALKINLTKIENSKNKIEYYKTKSTIDIKYANNYLNETMLYYNYLQELNSYYLSILLIGNVSDCMSYLR